MKRFYTLLVILCLFNVRSQAQYVQVSLDFQQMILSAYPTQSAGIFNGVIQMDTTATFVRTLRHMDISNNSQSIMQNIDGLQYFDSLRYLNCAGNAIETITALPPNLDTLICSGQLYPLFFHWTTLGTLPPLPASLRYLDCKDNTITSLSLPGGLTWLDCSNQYFHMSTGDIITELVDLSGLPDSLRYITGSISNASFSQMPFSLVDMSIYAPNLTQLPELPPGLEFLAINAPLSCLPSLPPSMAGNSPYNTANYNLFVTGGSITCIPNDVPGMIQNPSSTILPVCNSSNNPNNCPNSARFWAGPAITGLRTLPGIASASASYTLYGYNFSTATGNVTVSSPTPSLEISIDNVNFTSSPIIIPYTNSQILMPVYVRISNTATLGGISANIINSTAGFTDVYVPVSGDVVNAFIEANPAGITGLNGFTGEASASLSYTLNGMGLTPVAGSISVTPSAGLEVSTDNINFSSTGSVPYTNGTVNAVPVYVRWSNPAVAGSASGLITNSGGGVTDALVAVGGTISLSGIIAGPDITGLSSVLGSPSATVYSPWVAQHVFPNMGTLTVTASPGFEVSSLSSAFSTTVSVPYESGMNDNTGVRISSTAPAGPISGTITYTIPGYADAVVNVSGYVHAPVITAGPSISGLTTITGTASASGNYTLSAADLYPAAGNLSITASTGLELSTDNANFAPALTVPYTGGVISATTIYVRISATAPAGAINSTVTNSGGGAANVVVSVSGNVDGPTISAGPAISGLITQSGMSSASASYNLSATFLNPAAGNLTLTASSGLEISTDNTTFWGSLSIPYTGGTLASMPIYVRITPFAPVGAINGSITNSGGGATNVIVSVSGTVSAGPVPVITAGPAISGLNTPSGTASAPASYSLSAIDLNPASGNITVTASAALEVSTDNINFSASVLVPYIGGILSATSVYVRISSSAPVGAVNGTITNSGGGATDALVSVSGNVSAAPVPVITAGPGISGLNTQSGTASASASYSLSATDLNPASGNIAVTASASLEVSTDNMNFSSSLTVPYNGGVLATTSIYVRISSNAAVGAVNGTITNSGGGATGVIVNVSGNVSAAPVPVITAGPDISGLNTQSGTASASASYSLSGTDLNPASGSITVTASAALEVSTDNTNFSVSVSVPYTGGILSAASIYVRISSSAPVGAVNGTITNSGGGAANAIVSVGGNVSSAATPVITAGPDITGLSASGGNASAAQTYTLSASDLVPASGNITVTASPSLEVSTDNINFSSAVLVPYSGGSLAATTIYVRIAAGTPTGTISGTITNSGGGAADALVQVSGNSARPAAIAIGPNPARDMVTVYLPGNAAPVAISIIDENGRVLRTLSTNKESVQIYISNLARGFYTIKLRGDNMAESRRLIIN